MTNDEWAERWRHPELAPPHGHQHPGGDYRLDSTLTHDERLLLDTLVESQGIEVVSGGYVRVLDEAYWIGMLVDK